MTLQSTEVKRELEELKQTKKTDQTNFQRKSKNQEKQIQMMQVDVVEKDGTIEKLRELLEQRDERIEVMMLEIEKTQKRLLEVQDALHEAQQDNY